MKIKASGRWALMLATGLSVCFAGPLPAKAASSDPAASKSDTETSGKSVRQSSRHSKHTADRKSSKTADKPAETKKAADAADTGNNAPPAVIPASVANANAELPAAADNASAMTAKANTILAASDNKPAGQADSDVVASDQLNDVDRALQQATPADAPPQPQQQAQLQVQPPQQQTVAMASAKPVLASADSSPWDQTSLIGKIFIAFGALLTVASAARMFMA